MVEEVELSRRLWPVRPRAKLDVDRFRPLEGVVGVDALRRGLEKWVTADRPLGVSPSKVEEAAVRAGEMAHENDVWRLRLRAASARAGVVLPPRMRGTVPEVPEARFSAGWPGRSVRMPRGSVAEQPAPPAGAERSEGLPRGAGPAPDPGGRVAGAPAPAVPASPGGRWVNRRGVPTFVPQRESRAERLRRVGIAAGWIAPEPPAAKGEDRKPSEYDKQDWGRVLSALEKGADPGEVVKALAGMRTTGHGAKSDPLGYARKTVKRAEAHLQSGRGEGDGGDTVRSGGEPVATDASGADSESWREAALRRVGRGEAGADDPPKPPAPAGTARNDPAGAPGAPAR